MNTIWKNFIKTQEKKPEEQVQKRIGLVGGVFLLITGLGAYLSIGPAEGILFLSAILNPGGLLLMGLGIAFVFSGIFLTQFLRMFQAAVFFIIGSLGCLLTQIPGILTGPVLFMYGIILAFQYGFLDRHMLGKIVVLFILYSGSNVLLCLFTPLRPLYMGIIDIGITMLLFYFLWVAFAEEIRFHREKNKRMREELEENRLFIQFGKHMAGLIHNIKSKLMSIRGFNEVLEKYVKDPKSETFLTYQKRAIDQMIDLTSNLLFSVKSFNESSTHVVSLDKVVQGLLEIYSSDSVFSREVRIKTALRQAYCVASPREIIIMVENLVTNALEAMDGTDKKELHIETGMQEKRSFISVSDTGEGFSFCPVNCTRATCIDCPYIGYGKTTKAYGTGLGMATLRDTLKSLRGDVIIDSTPGKGSSVKIFLPLGETA